MNVEFNLILSNLLLSFCTQLHWGHRELVTCELRVEFCVLALPLSRQRKVEDTKRHPDLTGISIQGPNCMRMARLCLDSPCLKCRSLYSQAAENNQHRIKKPTK